MSLVTLPADSAIEDVVVVIDRDGGVIISDYVSADVVADLEADLRPHLNRQAFGDGSFLGTQTRRLGAIFSRSRHCEELVLHPLLHAVAREYLCKPGFTWNGEERIEFTSNYQMGVSQVIDIYPGQGAQPLHRDDMVWHWTHPEGGRQARVQVMFALSDFTAENGGTRVVPGSHLWGDDRAPKANEAVPTVMKAGSALIWLGGTFHSGGINESTSSRTGITFGLDLGFLRQEENQYLTYSIDQVRGFSEGVQRLLGYEASAPFIGWLEDGGVMRDPMFVLGEGYERAEVEYGVRVDGTRV